MTFVENSAERSKGGFRAEDVKKKTLRDREKKKSMRDCEKVDSVSNP
jgi:hypothetical protein